MSMKREFYLKPQTQRELLAMEQGLCAASVYEKNNNINTKGHEVGNTYTFDVDGESNGFSVKWD